MINLFEIKKGELGTAALESVIASTNKKPDLRESLFPLPGSWELAFKGLDTLDGIDNIGDTSSKVCIATEDIVGPVRNGGIGTTYSYLAQLLASEGFEVTILYLRGDYVEIGTIEHWINYYKKLGVNFVVVEDYFKNEAGRTISERWTRPMYNMFRHLQAVHYDVVHVSEWRGSAYLSLLAKKQGLEFQKTHFVVKCSSPFLWNRLYGNNPVKNLGDIHKMFCEQKSVEFGDHIVGGSTHLLRWMASQGYNINTDCTFVQPNIISTEKLKSIISKRNISPGLRTSVEEIVFFGRLEERKGLGTFVQAINALIRDGVSLPPKITFMGKPGGRLPSHPGKSVLDFIDESTSKWRPEVSVLTEFQQQEALTYLLAGNRLAVMPSNIENSSLAVYEAVLCGIPFIASDVGGTSELIHRDYHDDVLFDAHPYTLSVKLKEVLEKGAAYAAPSFENSKNISTWIQYHKNIKHIAAQTTKVIDQPNFKRLAVLLPFRDDIEGLKITLKSLENQKYENLEVIVFDCGSSTMSAKIQLKRISRFVEKKNWKFFKFPDIDFSQGLNEALKHTKASQIYITFPGNALLPGALTKLTQVMNSCNLGAVTSFSLEYSGKAPPRNKRQACALHMPIIGNFATTMLERDSSQWDMLVNRDAINAVGGFSSDYRLLNYEKELLQSIELVGFQTETIPYPLYWKRKLKSNSSIFEGYNTEASEFRLIRPAVKYSPLLFRNLLLLMLGLNKITKVSDEQFQKTKKSLSEKSAKLKARNAELEKVRKESAEKSAKLKARNAELEKVRKESTEKSAKLKARNAELEKVRKESAEKSAKLKARNAELEKVRKESTEKSAKLKARNAELEKVRKKATS